MLKNKFSLEFNVPLLKQKTKHLKMFQKIGIRLLTYKTLIQTAIKCISPAATQVA